MFNIKLQKWFRFVIRLCKWNCSDVYFLGLWSSPYRWWGTWHLLILSYIYQLLTSMVIGWARWLEVVAWQYINHQRFLTCCMWVEIQLHINISTIMNFLKKLSHYHWQNEGRVWHLKRDFWSILIFRCFTQKIV